MFGPYLSDLSISEFEFCAATAILGNHVGHVFGVGAKEQVFGITATRVIACVADA